MKYVSLPQLTNKPVPTVGVGAMLLAEPLRSTGELMPWDDAIGILHHTFEQGITLVDTADIYAPDAAHFGYDERLVGEAVRTWKGGRDSIIVVTKIGITLKVRELDTGTAYTTIQTMNKLVPIAANAGWGKDYGSPFGFDYFLFNTAGLACEGSVNYANVGLSAEKAAECGDNVLAAYNAATENQRGQIG